MIWNIKICNINFECLIRVKHAERKRMWQTDKRVLKGKRKRRKQTINAEMKQVRHRETVKDKDKTQRKKRGKKSDR